MAGRGSTRAHRRKAAVIDKRSPVPFYHQLKLVLRAQIETGELQPGDALPGEMRLCDAYAVSRTVVRQALIQLEFEGLIERQKGRGTFVARPKTPQRLVQSLAGQFEDMAARGLRLRSLVRRLELVPADPAVADRLQVPERSEVVLLERVRSISAEPWVLAITYLPADTLPVLLAADLSRNSLYAALDAAGIRPVHGHRTLEAREAGKTVAEALSLKRTAPVLLLTSVGFDQNERPVEYFEAFHRADRSRFEVDVVRNDIIMPV